MKHKLIDRRIGYDCPYRDECRQAEEKEGGVVFLALLMLFGGMVIGAIAGVVIWHNLIM